MDIITERTNKWQFTEKLHLDKKLIEELEQHLGNPNLRFIISWYDGYDLNNIHSYKKYILKEDKDHIKDEIEFVLNKILSSTDIMIFVGYFYVDSKESKFKNVLLHYKVPTDGYKFDKDLGKWIKYNE